jgi:hypothetical protein
MSRMTVLGLAVAVLVGFLLAPLVMAADVKPTTFKGTIVEIKDKVKVVVKDKDGKKVDFNTDAKTEVSIDGKKGKVADLNSGMEVTVTPPKGLATKIDAKKK